MDSVIRFNLPAEAAEAVQAYCSDKRDSPSDYYRAAIDKALEATDRPAGRVSGMPLHGEKVSACVRLDAGRMQKVKDACAKVGRDGARSCPTSQWIAAAVCKRALRFYCTYQKVKKRGK